MTRRTHWTLYPFKVEEDYNGELTLTAQPKAVEGIAAALELEDAYASWQAIFEKWTKRGWMHLDAFDIGYAEEGLVLSKSLTYRMPVDGEATGDASKRVTVRVGDEHPAWYVARDLLTNWAAGGSVRFTRETALPKVENMDGSVGAVDLAKLRDHWLEEIEANKEAEQAKSRVYWLEGQCYELAEARDRILDVYALFDELHPLRWDEPRDVSDLRDALYALPSGALAYDPGEWNPVLREWGSSTPATAKGIGPDPERYPVACPACGARAGTECSCKSREIEIAVVAWGKRYDARKGSDPSDPRPPGLWRPHA